MDRATLIDLLKTIQKPAYYMGGELNSVKKELTADMLRYCFCFPDTYEIGMSNLAQKILYSVLNSREDIWCERVFAPCDDMEEMLRERKLPLYALESYSDLSEFHLLGFTLQTELNYTNILNMLELAEIPLLAADRKELFPLVHAGGSCGYNPEPLADFFDFFIMGEGEEVNVEVCDLINKLKSDGCTEKSTYLRELAKIEGIYVPSLYETEYFDDGKIKSFTPLFSDVPAVIKKRIVKDMDKVHYPKDFVVPFCNIVHDRVMVECFRGCIRGCRFCQAGYIYRPIREKSKETIDRCAKELIANTGYDELSLLSLSTTDYSELGDLTDMLLSWCDDKHISVSLPSLRIDNFDSELLAKIQKVRKGGLTFAPEAGTQRMRDVINKNISEEEILSTAGIAFSGGYNSIKLYFMAGLPYETDEDMLGIATLGEKIVEVFYRTENRNRAKPVKVTISCASFIPKPYTPFQWCAQDKSEIIDRKFQLIKGNIKSNKVFFKYHGTKMGHVEALLARGDRRVGEVILGAFKRGAKFDGWDNKFLYEAWTAALEEQGLSFDFYNYRERDYDEILPWDFVDIGVTKEHLISESDKAKIAATTPNCKISCANCGASVCFGVDCDR